MTKSLDAAALSQLSLTELQQQLGTSPKGLSQTVAHQRLAQNGYNQLSESTVSPLRQFLSHFWGPIAWMIEIAVILSALVGDWVDFGLILALLIAKVFIGVNGCVHPRRHANGAIGDNIGSKRGDRHAASGDRRVGGD